MTGLLSISSVACTDEEETISVATPRYEDKDSSSSFSVIHSLSESDPQNLSTDENAANLTTTELENDDLLLSKGFKRHRFISKTLQGEIFTANKVDSDESVVIKVANKKLHQNGTAMTADGRLFRSKENIFKEAMIMKKFMQLNPPKSCIKYHSFFWDSTQFYLVMEQAGKGLFEFVVECHKHIKTKKLSLHKWRKYVAQIFKEMAKCIAWMHNKMQCCHLDISLENVCVGRNTYFDEKEGEIKNLEIRFIDFGLSEIFNINDEFVCSRFVGKPGYKSPQIYAKKEFHANKADIWSLGVALFMMIIGAPPYSAPSAKDGAFALITNGKLKQLLNIWGRSHYTVPHLEDLISKMLRYDEEKRIEIDEIVDHIWLNPKP